VEYPNVDVFHAILFDHGWWDKLSLQGHFGAEMFDLDCIETGSGASRAGLNCSEETSMRVGCPKEIKNHEYRVGLTPGAVREYVAHGHEVIVETKAGMGIGEDDAAYQAAGPRSSAAPRKSSSAPT
jgi:hypothetical protein